MLLMQPAVSSAKMTQLLYQNEGLTRTEFPRGGALSYKNHRQGEWGVVSQLRWVEVLSSIHTTRQ